MTRFGSFRDFAKHTTVTQISLAARAVYWRLRWFWFFLLIACLGVTFYQTGSLLTNFFQHRKIAVITIENRALRPFPAVTVCNLNAIKYSAMVQVPGLSALLPPHVTRSSKKLNENEQIQLKHRKKRSATSCWTKNSSAFYTITNPNTSQQLTFSSGQQPCPSGSGLMCLIQQRMPANGDPSPFLWQIFPYGNPDDGLYVFYNVNSSMVIDFTAQANYGDWVMNYNPLSCSPNQKFAILDDPSGIGCNIATSDNRYYLGLYKCFSPENGILLLLNPTDCAQCETFVIKEYSGTSIQPVIGFSSACSSPSMVSQPYCQIDVTKFYYISVYDGFGTTLYLTASNDSTVFLTISTGSEDQQWLFKRWTTSTDNTYGVYNKMYIKMLTIRTGNLTIDSIWPPMETERFALQQAGMNAANGGKYGYCFLYTTDITCNTVLKGDGMYVKPTGLTFGVVVANHNLDVGKVFWLFTPVSIANVGAVIPLPVFPNANTTNQTNFTCPFQNPSPNFDINQRTCNSPQTSTTLSVSTPTSTSSKSTSTSKPSTNPSKSISTTPKAPLRASSFSTATLTSSNKYTSAARASTRQTSKPYSNVSKSVVTTPQGRQLRLQPTGQSGVVPTFTNLSQGSNAILKSIKIPVPITKEQFNNILQLDVHEKNFNNIDPVSVQTTIATSTPYLISSLADSQKMSLGYSAAEFLSKCFYAGIPCNFTHDFYQWYDPSRGNCFTFNHKKAINQHQSYRAGSGNGLSLTVNSSQLDYMPSTISAGIIAVINSQNVAAFTDKDFVLLSPQSVVDLEISYTTTERLGDPFGECIDQPSPSNYYYEGDYTVDGCTKTCHQKNVLRICGCGDPSYLLPANEPQLNEYCDLFKKNCVDQVSANETDMTTETEKECYCPNPCNEEVFSFTMTLLSAKQSKRTMSQEMVVLNVYYNNYLTLAFQESPLYDLNSFLSDFGGIVGNYLSCSFVSLFEMIFLLGTLFL